jgi:hypothetical protein
VSISVAQRSLRKLRNLGLLTVHVSALEQPSHFTITKRAAVLLSENCDHPLESLRVPRGIGKIHLKHHDGVAFLYASGLRAGRLQSDFSLEQFQFEDKIRRSLGLTKAVQVPDAICVWKSKAGHRLGWAIEQDESTESIRFVVERKAKNYAELQANRAPLAGVLDWCIVCIVPTEDRLKRLVTALYEAGIPEKQWYFAVKNNLRAETVLTSAWRTVRTSPDGERAELVTLPPLPVSTDCPNRPDRHEENFPTVTPDSQRAKGVGVNPVSFNTREGQDELRGGGAHSSASRLGNHPC